MVEITIKLVSNSAPGRRLLMATRVSIGILGKMMHKITILRRDLLRTINTVARMKAITAIVSLFTNISSAPLQEKYRKQFTFLRLQNSSEL